MLPLVSGNSTPELVRAAAEGAVLGAYEFRTYRGQQEGYQPPPTQIELVVSKARDKDTQQALAEAAAISEAVALARDLVNTAPNDLPPAELAARAQTAARKVDLDVEILDEKALQKGGFGGVLGVGGGSSRPPRLVRLTYKGSRATSKVALIGKGITFDTGGISLKPADSMHTMKSDMGGAAAVIATIIAAATLKLPLEITATVPIAENMPGGGAPSRRRAADVRREDRRGPEHRRRGPADPRRRDRAGLRGRAGVPAGDLDPDRRADDLLGRRTTGVMGSDELRDRVARLGSEAGEAAWAMPLPAELRSGLDSVVADLANVAGNRAGGMLVAGHFLRGFVADGLRGRTWTWPGRRTSSGRRTATRPRGHGARCAPWCVSPKTSPPGRSRRRTSRGHRAA